MPIKLFGECKTTDPQTQFTDVITNAVTNDGVSFTDFNVVDRSTPDFDFTIPGSVYRIRMAMAWPATSAKNFYFGGHQWSLYFSDADWALLSGKIFWDTQFPSAAPFDVYTPGSAGLEFVNAPFLNPAAGFSAGDPASHTLLEGAFISTAFHDIFASSVTIDANNFWLQATNSPFSNAAVARAFKRNELVQIVFAGQEYLRTALATIYIYTDPCSGAPSAPMKIRSVAYRDNAWTDTLNGTGLPYSSTCEMQSHLLIDVAPDHNYEIR